MQYEAWIEKGMTNRIITIEAVGVREAFRLADEQCDDGEFVRGVNPVEGVNPATGQTWLGGQTRNFR